MKNPLISSGTETVPIIGAVPFLLSSRLYGRSRDLTAVVPRFFNQDSRTRLSAFGRRALPPIGTFRQRRITQTPKDTRILTYLYSNAKSFMFPANIRIPAEQQVFSGLSHPS